MKIIPQRDVERIEYFPVCHTLVKPERTLLKHDDEYGNLAGIATLEDMVEEVFGEIFDEHEPGRDLERGDDGSITVSGSFDVDHLREYFAYRPEEETESATVGGLVTEWLGAVPEPGAVVARDGISIEVLSADGMRVERVRIRAKPEEDENRDS